MKICILTHTFPRYTGDPSAPFMANLAEALAETRNDVFVLTPFDPEFKKRNLKYKIFTYKYIWPASLHKVGYSRVLKGDQKLTLQMAFLATIMSLFGLFALIRLCKKENIDVVSAHWVIPNGFIAFLASFVTGKPYTISIPGSDVFLASKNLFFKTTLRLACRKASTVISDSLHYLNEMEKLGARARNKAVIRYGVNPLKFKPGKRDASIVKKLGINLSDKVILCVGRLVAKKGFLYLIRAFPFVLKHIPDAKLVIVGDGDQKDELEQEVDKLNIKSQVIFAGTISYDQLSKYYNLGDVFVMPSIRDEAGNIDASPVAMMEAMSCGTPVVATKFSGNDELIQSGKTGFLVSEKESDEIAKAIVNLLKEGSGEKRKEAVRQIAIDNFSTKVVARRYIEHFKFALTKK